MPLTPDEALTVAKIELARDKIRLSLRERDELFPELKPQYPWAECTRWLSYIFFLPGEQLRSIRLHCDLFLGENTPNVFFSGSSEGQTALYRWLGDGVDRTNWASEPLVPILGRGLGGDTDGKTVNQTTLLLQRYACNLHRLGLKDGDSVVEIGAGYGGLAESIIRAKKVRYTIIDLPDTLLFSAAFLINHFPHLNIYVYEPGDFENRDWTQYDIILIPNFRVDWLRSMPRQNYAVNTVSFPEMGRDELRQYRDILADVLDGPLMSVNYHGDRGDGLGVPDILAERFTLTPTPEQIVSGLNIGWAAYKDLNFRPTIVCEPHGKERVASENIVLRDQLSTHSQVAVQLGRLGSIRPES